MRFPVNLDVRTKAVTSAEYGWNWRTVLRHAVRWARHEPDLASTAALASAVLGRGTTEGYARLSEPEYVAVLTLLEEASTYWANVQAGDGEPLPEEQAWLADIATYVSALGRDAGLSSRSS